jgi:hypothetical protein
MKKIVLVTFAALLITGCGLFPTPAVPTEPLILESPTAAPTETQTALPTETPVPVTETFTSTPEPLLNPTITLLPAEDLTAATASATVEAVGVPTNTPTAISSFPSSVTPTPTNGILTYGTLPPAVPFNTITLWNRSKVEAYISLQQQDGKQAIIEYPVRGQISVDIPLGSYLYVAWVGGNKMTGSFKIDRSDSLTIVLFKDKIVVNK